MKRSVTLAVVLVLVMVITSTGVSAGGSGVATADVYVDASLPTQNTNSYLALAVGTTAGLCTPDNNEQITYLRWDVTDWIGKSIGSAKITLNIVLNSYAAGQSGAQLTLYKVANDTWDPSVITWASGRPTFNTALAGPDVIETIQLSVGQLGLISFGADSPASSALATYLNEQAVIGDGQASFALQLTSCPGETQGMAIWFDDSVSGSPTAVALDNAPTAPAVATAPYLYLSNPTAVTMSTFRAADPAVNWPLIAGLGALAAILIGGLAVARKRAATH